MPPAESPSRGDVLLVKERVRTPQHGLRSGQASVAPAGVLNAGGEQPTLTGCMAMSGEIWGCYTLSGGLKLASLG